MFSSSIDPNITTSGKFFPGEPICISSPYIYESNVQPTNLGTAHSSDPHTPNELSSAFNSSMASIYGNSYQDCTCLQDSFPRTSNHQIPNVHELHLTISQAKEINDIKMSETPASIALDQSISSEQPNPKDLSIYQTTSESVYIDRLHITELSVISEEYESMSSESIHKVQEDDIVNPDSLQFHSTDSNDPNLHLNRSLPNNESRTDPNSALHQAFPNNESLTDSNGHTIPIPPESTPRSKTPPPFDNTTMCCLLL